MNAQHARDLGQWRPWQTRLARAAGILLLLLSAPQAAWAAAPAPFLMATGREDSVFTGKWFRRIYVEAFRRMGVPMDVAVFPLARISDELDQGRLDGEMFRI